MSIRIIKQDEKLTFSYEGEKYHYRRPTLQERKRWTQNATDKRGNTDAYKLIEMVIPSCLIGWEPGAVIDETGANIDYSAQVALALPEDFYVAFLDCLGMSNPEGDSEIKNSKSTSN